MTALSCISIHPFSVITSIYILSLNKLKALFLHDVNFIDFLF